LSHIDHLHLFNLASRPQSYNSLPHFHSKLSHCVNFPAVLSGKAKHHFPIRGCQPPPSITAAYTNVMERIQNHSVVRSASIRSLSQQMCTAMEIFCHIKEPAESPRINRGHCLSRKLFTRLPGPQIYYSAQQLFPCFWFCYTARTPSLLSVAPARRSAGLVYRSASYSCSDQR
jgi:hypothetical protein